MVGLHFRGLIYTTLVVSEISRKSGHFLTRLGSCIGNKIWMLNVLNHVMEGILNGKS